MYNVCLGRKASGSGFNLGQNANLVVSILSLLPMSSLPTFVLQVQTNFHRSCKFGLCLNDMNKYECTSLNANMVGHVSGISHYAMKVVQKRIMTIGLT